MIRMICMGYNSTIVFLLTQLVQKLEKIILGLIREVTNKLIFLFGSIFHPVHAPLSANLNL